MKEKLKPVLTGELTIGLLVGIDEGASFSEFAAMERVMRSRGAFTGSFVALRSEGEIQRKY